VTLEQGPVSWAIPPLPILSLSQFAHHDERRRRRRATWPPGPPSRDRAWLGVFLF
jgi:hypothetical protein